MYSVILRAVYYYTLSTRQFLLPIMLGITLGPRRVHVAMLVFLGLLTNYMLRVNLNLTIEYMTTKEGNDNYVEWTSSQQEDIKGAFYIGYFILQVPGGRVAEVFGTKRVFGYCMFVCAAMAALTPVCSCLSSSATSYGLVYTLRVVQGLSQSVCFPSLHPLTAKWSPEPEKGRFVSFSYLGGTFGSVVTFPLCGVIIDTLGWVWVFYITSFITFFWFLLWMLFVTDLPEDDPFITETEKKSILDQRPFNPQQLEADRAIPLVPLTWDIIKTPAVWVVMCCDFCNGFGLYILLTEGSAFIKNVVLPGYVATTIGLVTAAPQLARFLYGQVCGVFSDWVILKGHLSRLNMQKVNVILAFIIPGIGMIAMTFFTSNSLKWVGIAIMCVTFSFNGGTMAGHIQNIIGLAPNRSGTLYGVSNGFGNLSGFLVPEITKRIIGTCGEVCDTDVTRWRWLFIVAAGCYALTTTIFCVGAASKEQKFNNKTYSGVTTTSYMKEELSKLTHICKNTDTTKNNVTSKAV